MKKPCLLLAAASLLIGACAPQPISGGPRNCPNGSVITDTVTITSANGIGVAPPHICITPDTTIRVRIPNAKSKGSVATTPKVEDNFWLAGSNGSDANAIYLYAGPSVSPDDYDYNVYVQDVGMLDPRVSVRDEDS